MSGISKLQRHRMQRLEHVESPLSIEMQFVAEPEKTYSETDHETGPNPQPSRVGKSSLRLSVILHDSHCPKIMILRALPSGILVPFLTAAISATRALANRTSIVTSPKSKLFKIPTPVARQIGAPLANYILAGRRSNRISCPTFLLDCDEHFFPTPQLAGFRK
jgi:hypothetical protein